MYVADKKKAKNRQLLGIEPCQCSNTCQFNMKETMLSALCFFIDELEISLHLIV